MDLPNFDQMRYLRIVSHNGNSSAPDGEPSASNFNVVMESDITRVGEITGYSLDNITFPNVFPNIRDDGDNNLLVWRYNLPTDDGYRIFADHLVYTTAASQTITVPLGPSPIFPDNNTVAQIAWLGIQPGIAGVFAFTVDPYGIVTMISLIGPVQLQQYLGIDTWNEPSVGIDSAMQEGFQTVWIGYPGPFNYVTVPRGYYDQTQLGTYVQSVLPLIFTVTIADVGGNAYYVIQNLVAQFYLVPLIIRKDLGKIEPNYRQLVYQMGFQVLPNAPYNTIMATLNPALQGEQIAYLHSQILSASRKSYSGEGNADSVIACIPINAPYGSVVDYNPNQWSDPGFVLERGISPREFDFSLKNQYNENLDIGWNQTMTLFFRMFFNWRVPQ